MRTIKLDRNIAKEILEKNIKREHKNFSKYACSSNKAIRFKEEEIPDKINIRPTFFHDTDKIIHSLAYTRYIDKTQVFYLFDNDHITHRVLHVQLVSKIARVIGRALSLNEDLIEAISLAHDLGHVPYGHNGERKLNSLTFDSQQEYFTHNAQSVRSLMFLENKGMGLNLTLQVLDGVLCHNGELMLNEYRPEYGKQKESFFEEYSNCWEVKNYGQKIISMSLEGCVMRISDVIAYIGRDLEDSITLGLIKRKDIPTEVKKVIGDSNADIINNIAIDLINNSFDCDRLKLSNEIYDALKCFYEFSNNAIYNNCKKTTQDKKIDFMFEVLYQRYLNDLEKDLHETSISKYFVNNMSENYRNSTKNHRMVCDYISGMTDKFFNNEFKNMMIPESFGYNLK